MSGQASVKPLPSKVEEYAPYAPSPQELIHLTRTLYCVAFSMPQNSVVVMLLLNTVTGEPLVPPRSISTSVPLSSD